MVADWAGRGYGIVFFEKSWGNWTSSRIFEHTRPRNEPGKAVLGNSVTQDDGRSSRNHLEWVWGSRIQEQIEKSGFLGFLYFLIGF